MTLLIPGHRPNPTANPPDLGLKFGMVIGETCKCIYSPRYQGSDLQCQIGQEVFCLVAPRNNHSGLITQFWIVLVIFNDICSLNYLTQIGSMTFVQAQQVRYVGDWTAWIFCPSLPPTFRFCNSLEIASTASISRLDISHCIYLWLTMLCWFDWVVGFITPNKHQMSLMCSRQM